LPRPWQRAVNHTFLTFAQRPKTLGEMQRRTVMKKVVRLIVVVLTLVGFSAAFADVGGTTSKGGGRSQAIIFPTDLTSGEDGTLLLPWQAF
jgi:hypothetical protein